MQNRRPVYNRQVVLGILTLALMAWVFPVRGDGVVTTCSEAGLRAALIGGGVVTFSSDCSITISQQIVINASATTINSGGFNVSISGGGMVPIFNVATNLTLVGLTIVSGLSPTSGGALYVQPGVSVFANQCVFAGNLAAGTNGLNGLNGATNSNGTGGDGFSAAQGVSAFGGAIYNLGYLALSDCTLTNNSATGGAGGNGGNGGGGGGTFAVGGNGGDGAPGGQALGGAVYNLGDLTLLNCTFSSNTAVGGIGGTGGAGGGGNYVGVPGNGAAGGYGLGGAVYNARNLTVIASTFATNSTQGGASSTGGMDVSGTGKTGVKGALGAGGAIYNAWWAVMTNCTFYTNSVLGGAGGNGGAGGGTFGVPGNGGDGGDAVGGALDNANTVTIVNCTFSSSGAFGGTNGIPGTGNFTASNGNLGVAQGGNIANAVGVITLMNSILDSSVSGANAFGSLDDAGYNLSSDSVASFQSLSFQNLDPLLAPLADNGGPTLTMALLTNSPAIDKIPPNLAPPTDQRGAHRPINGRSDIGAFEFGSSLTISNVMLTIGVTTNGVIQVAGAGTVGLSYVVQASPDLSSWQPVSTNISPFVFTDSVTNGVTRFYRVTR